MLLNVFLPGVIFPVISGADPGFDQGGAPDRDRPKTAILGPQFCRILVLGPHFWWSGGGARGPPLDPPLHIFFSDMDYFGQKCENKE